MVYYQSKNLLFLKSVSEAAPQDRVESAGAPAIITMEAARTSLSASSTLVQSSAPAPHQVLSTQDWESKKHIIRSMYITKDLPLDEVIGRMTKDHGFKATLVVLNE